MAPKRAKLAEAEATYAAVMAGLKEKQQELQVRAFAALGALSPSRHQTRGRSRRRRLFVPCVHRRLPNPSVSPPKGPP